MTRAYHGKSRYEVFGPFSFDTTKGVRHRKALRQFWTDRDRDGSPEGLSNAVGVYVWTFKEGAARIPWNVGITSKQGFKGRFPQKEATFLRLLVDRPNAKIEVYLLARRTRAGAFSKTRQKKLNDWLETMLIGSAISINHELRNSAKSKYLRTTIVDGYLNDGEERGQAARSFSAVFKAQSRKRN
jgi:hypothetical protein